MTFAGDAEAYKRMLSESFGRKACEAEESCGEYLVLPKCEHIEETLVVGEEIVVDENLEMNQQEEIEESKETRLFFQDEGDSDRVAVEFVECGGQMAMDEEDRRWEETEGVKQLPLAKEDNDTEVSCAEVASDDQDADEETIATFVTAAGQQLALYAVEDSEEIFAVAVYDESGEPPTNFQFLMKADVERLIGEGAVRTVKKPTQIKKQLLTTQPPLFFSKAEPVHHVALEEQQKILTDETIVSNQRIRRKNSWHDDSDILQEDLSLDDKPVPNIIYATGGKQSDVTYLMMDNCSVNIDDPDDMQEDEQSDEELVEQSTVQYILLEGDQSDSELTFDEIQATLQNLKRPKAARKPPRRQRDQSSLSKASDLDYLRRSASSHSKTLAERRLNFLESRRELLDTLGDSTPDASDVSCKLDLSGESAERPASPESAQALRFRAKRPRKQQLTSVNREDSEIIIQPASLLSEEDTASRKRGKRKRRVVAGHAAYARSSESKRPRRARRKEVEVIELDAEEEEKRDVVEITIDDSKDKYSSDKENEIIMVGDSDEESQQSDPKTGVLQCRHCARNFRQQRALETHLRVCSKSPSNAVRFVERERRQEQKKQYACKVCQAKFDVVVALARHVRAEHSQRKRRRFSKSSMEREPEEPPPPPEERKERKLAGGLGRARRKRGQKRPGGCAWEVKKLSCADCGRWFPSAALLRAHCLQHGTKKSEQQIRRCQICKKLIKSRLLFVRHLKKHGSGGTGGGGGGQQAARPVTNMQKKLHTTRSVTRKITLRKRGRPRKL